MCSVRKRPIPSAPKLRATVASAGVSALVRTPIVRNLSARPMNCWKRGFSEASISSIVPKYAYPLVPSKVKTSPSLITTPVSLTVAFLPSTSTWRAPAPTMQHFPQPRATKAACEVIPPRAVKIPSAARIPSTSSGLVSSRTNNTFSPLRCHSTASSAVKTTLPTAAPGPAGNPLTKGWAPFNIAGLMIGCNNSSSWAGSRRKTAVFSSIRPSANISIAIFKAAVPVRFPTRHCNMNNLPSWIVNSMSSISLNASSKRLRISNNSVYESAQASSMLWRCLFCSFLVSSLSGLGVRIPATTSSPCALINHSP